MAIPPNTELRRLHITHRQHLAEILDLLDGWRELAGIITRSAVDPEPLYRDEHLNVFARTKKSPTLLLLDDWGTRGKRMPTIQTLLDHLIKLNQFRAADYITTVVLKAQISERSNVWVADRVPITSKPPRGMQEPNSESPITVDGNDGAHHNPTEKGMDASESSASASAASAIPHISFNTLFMSTMGFSPNQKLGQGGFGTVYIGILELNGVRKNVAVKKLKIGEDEQFHTELNVMTRYSHEHLLQILAFSCDNPQGRCLICAYMANGSLEDRLAQKNSTPPLQWKNRLHIAIGTAKGLVALHTMHAEALVHRDIKSANILLDANLNAKIGDFGIARLGSNWEKTTQMITSRWSGTPVYMADEALRGSITVKMDTYSFGVVLLELLTGLPPFDNQRREPDLLSHIEEEEKEANEWKDPKAGDWPENVAAGFFDVATRCIERKRRMRPLVEEILPDLEALQTNDQPS